jgi:hypothetical protein
MQLQLKEMKIKENVVPALLGHFLVAVSNKREGFGRRCQ